MDFVADYLFDADHGTVARDVREASSDVFLNGQFITLHDPGVLLVTIAGPGASGMRAKVTDAVAQLQNPMDRKTFESARNAFLYHIISQVQTPQTRADNFGWYAVEGNLPYAPGDTSGDYVQAAQSLDPGYVAQIVRRYLQHPAVVELAPAHAQGSAT
jgi:predicted Zn-dependent peptidase